MIVNRGKTIHYPLKEFTRNLKALGQVKKNHMFLVRISIEKRAGGRFFFLLIISYCMLSLNFITFSQGYVGALMSNINKTTHQMLIKHKFV